MLNPVFQDQSGMPYFTLPPPPTPPTPPPLFYFHLLSSLLIHYLLFVNRPNDRVSLKEMKADWHACLDIQVRFMVGCNYT